MSPVYSFGEDSPLKFNISDKLARYYNEAVSEYFKAQQRFNQKFGRKWDPTTDPIELRWNRRQRWAWNKFAKVLNNAVENDGRYHANDIMDDFLVKNVAGAAAVGLDWGGMLVRAAGGGALYELLSRR